MFRTDLTKIINEGNAWAFVGSGMSIDAGGPSWEQLVHGSIGSLDQSVASKVKSDKTFRKNLEAKRFPECFGRLENIAGRESLERGVNDQLRGLTEPGRITQCIAEMPFAGYITANYDLLLENALRRNGELGWSSVGNSENEIRQISGDARNLVWHIHGVAGWTHEKSHMILTHKDYDDVYLENSALLTQLRSLLSIRRIVFIGFGFQDEEVTRLLRRVGRLCSPARPAFAFLSGLYGGEYEEERRRLLLEFNVDVIPYRILQGSHEHLLQMLTAYSSFVLRRNLRLGKAAKECPSYDPETTSLLLYNRMVLQKNVALTGQTESLLLKSLVLSFTYYANGITPSELEQRIEQRACLINGTENRILQGGSQGDLLRTVIQELVEEGLVRISQDQFVSLTEEAVKQLEAQAGSSERFSRQFTASLRDRTLSLLPQDEQGQERIAAAAECFLKECVQRRSLGLAMALPYSGMRQIHQQFQTLSLLQGLPEYMEQLASSDEAIALVNTIQQVLARPSEVERKYLGLALQAQFAIHLLGYSPDAIRVRSEDFLKTFFLLDSSTIIPFLARGSTGHGAARMLVDSLRNIGCKVGTTKKLSNETAEHARWASRRLKSPGDIQSEEVLSIVTGRSGYRSNLFVEGFFDEMSEGLMPLNFETYLRSILVTYEGGEIEDEALEKALQTESIEVKEFDDWEGFQQELWSARDVLADQIAQLRKEARPSTYRRRRQVEAEGEACLIVEQLRKQDFLLNGNRMDNAYFISNTRVIDRVVDAGLPITMRPEPTLQWISTLLPCSDEEMGLFLDTMLWELQEKNLNVVDRSKLMSIFSPLISASRNRLEEELTTHRAAVSNLYGENPSLAFQGLDDLDVPVALNSIHAQRALLLEKRLQEQKRKIAELSETVRLSENEKQKLAMLEAKERAKKAKHEHRKRSLESRPNKGNRKKRRKG